MFAGETLQFTISVLIERGSCILLQIKHFIKRRQFPDSEDQDALQDISDPR